MYLSYLVYRCAKAAADYGDSAFDYMKFLTGEAAQDEDYSAFIDKALPVVNEFIQRCYELNKLPAKVANLGKVTSETPYLTLPERFGKAISLFQMNLPSSTINTFSEDSDVTDLIGYTSDYQVVAFRKQGNRLYPIGPFRSDLDFLLQYREKVPYFMEYDYPHNCHYEGEGTEYTITYNGTTYDDYEEMQQAEDIELEETYGFSDSLASICISFVQGRLLDDRSEGHSKEMEAESRLADVTLDETLYLQQKMVRRFR